jgi:hypothetical protein
MPVLMMGGVIWYGSERACDPCWYVMAAICCVRGAACWYNACWFAAIVCIAVANSEGTVDAWYVAPSVLPVVVAVAATCVTVVSTLDSLLSSNA